MSINGSENGYNQGQIDNIYNFVAHNLITNSINTVMVQSLAVKIQHVKAANGRISAYHTPRSSQHKHGMKVVVVV